MFEKIKNNLFLFLFWFIPLSLGLLSFFGWLITRFDFFLGAGIIALYIGVFTVLIGSIILLILRLLNKGNKLLRKFLLLLSNIIIGLLVAFVSITLLTMYIVIVENDSNSILTNCIIDGGGIHEEIEDIDPKKVVRKRFWIKHDGTLFFYCQNENKDIEIMIDGYVTNGNGGKKIVTVE